jgi:hypothetical protein
VNVINYDEVGREGVRDIKDHAGLLGDQAGTDAARVADRWVRDIAAATGSGGTRKGKIRIQYK